MVELLSVKSGLRDKSIIGSLSKSVFKRRTATGNETFSLFTRLGPTAFVIKCLYSYRDDLLEN